MNDLYPAQSDHPLFRYFDPGERARIEELAESRLVPKGDLLIREGEQDSRLFSIESGRLEIVGRRDGEAAMIASIGPGDVLGEVSFIDGSARSVSVTAAEDSRVLQWDRDILLSVLRGDPPMMAKFSVAMNELLVERLRDTVRRRV